MNNIIKPTIVISIVAFMSAFVLSHINKITKPDILRQAELKKQKALTLVLPEYEISKEKKIEIEGKSFIYWVGQKEVVIKQEETSDKKKKKKRKKKKKEDEPEKKIVFAYAFLTANPGYSGDVKSVVGVNENGKILGISILQQTETPGLGARCTEVASKETFFGMILGSKSTNKDDGVINPWFQQQFRTLDLNKKISILKMGDWNESIGKELLEKNAISAITGSTITSTAVTNSIKAGYEKLKKVIASNIEKKEKNNSEKEEKDEKDKEKGKDEKEESK